MGKYLGQKGPNPTAKRSGVATKAGLVGQESRLGSNLGLGGKE